MGKKYIYDEVKAEFEQRGYILLSDTYTNGSEKLQYVCKKHKDKGIQVIDFYHLHRGQGCRFCATEYNGTRRDLESYNAKELTESKGLEFVKITREDSVIYIYYICPKHRQYGVQRTSITSMRKNKAGCLYCIGKNKTTDVFKSELAIINPNIQVLGEYTRAADKIQCKCLVDGTEWYTTPNNLLNGEGCPECGKRLSANSRTKKNDQFLLELKDINDNIVPLEEYNGVKNKIWVYCKACDNKWQSTPDSLLQNGSCPNCAKIESHNRQVKSNEQFLIELKEINPMLTPLEPYYNDHTKILIRCDIHNYEWYAAPNKILHRNTGCPKCSIHSNEKRIMDIWGDMGYDVEPQKRFNDCRDKNPLPFDIYVKDLNLLIEYDGEQHYMPIIRGNMSAKDAENNLLLTQEHDRIKNQYCEQNNISLIRVPYWENKNIESFLMQQLKQHKINV